MLLFRAYVQQLGWRVQLHPTVSISDEENVGGGGSGGIHQATVDFLQTLLDWLKARRMCTNNVYQSTMCTNQQCTILNSEIAPNSEGTLFTQ